MYSELTAKERIEMLKKGAAEILESTADLYPTPSNPISTYKSPADNVIKTRSTTDGLQKLNAMLTGGTGGEVSDSVAAPENAKNADGKQDSNPAVSSGTKDGKEGDDASGKSPENLDPSKVANPAKIDMTVKEEDDSDISELFSEDESRILNKLISEMEKMDKNVISDIIGDDIFDDSTPLKEGDDIEIGGDDGDDGDDDEDDEDDMTDDLELEYDGDEDDFDIDEI